MNRYQDKIGCFVHIPNVGRGQLKYIGPVDTKPGIYVGVDLLANIGKNDGSFRSKRYFNTEYPQSGLFIQLQKIASLLDSAQPGQPTASRRSTMAPDLTFDSATRVWNRVSSSESTESTVVRRQISSDPLSPTPVRGMSGNSVLENGSQSGLPKQRTATRNGNIPDLEENVDHERDLDMVPPSSVPGRRTGSGDPSSHLLKEYQHKIERQDREILQFKRLLDDQRMVLEDIQPTIDHYESSLREMEKEMDTLRRRLKIEQEQQQKQKQFFETEHEQLLAVVEELHEEIKANEERVIMAQTSQNNGSESVPQLRKTISELMERVNFLEAAQTKWLKEKEQLKLQNESLSKEYSSLSGEYLRAQGNSHANVDADTQMLQQKLYNANVKIAQLEDLLQQQRHMRSPTYRDDTNIHNYRSDTVDSLALSRSKTKIEAAAGKEAWCALCERDGHQSIECPNELPLASERQEDLRSPSNDQLLF
ncbi:hypothetical protein HG536_0B00650 [Torulaspora globosa]|uniref:CAP-Gly domain-containing protein n=1 Tax=Torulaspora globosa TaxID=48254 RepID=A0A7G3ZCG8_9SACH|nr:uncharacterized protein HG536_0B00650 [Torulaspora globosa]QLL31204.1 hypothetical protein HG536_0B00650 [Torulaspora globosa]